MTSLPAKTVLYVHKHAHAHPQHQFFLKPTPQSWLLPSYPFWRRGEKKGEPHFPNTPFRGSLNNSKRETSAASHHPSKASFVRSFAVIAMQLDRLTQHVSHKPDWPLTSFGSSNVHRVVSSTVARRSSRPRVSHSSWMNAWPPRIEPSCAAFTQPTRRRQPEGYETRDDP